MNFRQCPGRLLRWIDTGIDKGFSNFLFIDKEYGSNAVLRRVFSLARKHEFQSLLIEEISEADCPLLAAENAAIRIRRPDFLGSTVHRIAFFCTPSEHAPAKSLIGYVIFKRDDFSAKPMRRDHVYECVLPPYRAKAQNNFLHCLRKYSVKTTQGEFEVEGILYAQQNDSTFVCAHVGIRTVLSSVLPEGDATYEKINALAGVDHAAKGDVGLDPDQIQAVFKGFNVEFHRLIHEPNDQLILPTDFQRDAYGFIESAQPALLGFELEAQGAPDASRHAIPIIGHTFNEDTWLPQAHRAYFGGGLSYYPSENWLSTFVVHDDNFGPYFCLPRHFLQKDKFRLLFGIKPYPTEYSAVEAEAIAFSYFHGLVTAKPNVGQEWYDRFSVFTTRGWLVIRTILVTKSKYIEHLRGLKSWDGTPMDEHAIDEAEKHLPAYFWMAEASAPELFASTRRKFGEVLVSATTPIPSKLDYSLFLGARLPSVFILNIAGTVKAQKTTCSGHTDLFSH